jgi:hypothetical protein
VGLNYGFGSIPSIPIHSSFQRPAFSPAQQVPTNVPEVHLGSKKPNSFFPSFQEQLEKENPIPLNKETRVPSSFQKTHSSGRSTEDSSFQIELDYSDGDVTFETLMEVENEE